MAIACAIQQAKQIDHDICISPGGVWGCLMFLEREKHLGLLLTAIPCSSLSSNFENLFKSLCPLASPLTVQGCCMYRAQEMWAARWGQTVRKIPQAHPASCTRTASKLPLACAVKTCMCLLVRVACLCLVSLAVAWFSSSRMCAP